MAVRVVNGSTFTEDGWPLVDQAGCTWITVAGSNPPVSLQIQSGVPATVMGAWAADWNAFIEPLRDADSASWTEGNSVLGGYGRNNGSNHLGGTAEDLNWNSHPFRKRGSLNAAQMATLKEMEDFYEGTMFWAGRWDDPADEMHSQMGYDTYDRASGDAYPWVKDFITRKIRPDGFSTFRRGGTPGHQPAAAASVDVLRAAMSPTGASDATLISYLGPFGEAMRAAQINSVLRAAAWCSQIGHESVGLKYMAEIQTSGPDWSWDRTRYRGRGPIQLTWSGNYSKFGQWCVGEGFTDDPEMFVDQPELVEQPRWGFLAASWYWLNAGPRPGEINDFADQGDILAVSRCINGWVDTPNGMPDRTARYNRALELGDQLLTLTSTGDDDMFTDDDRNLLNQIAGIFRPSRSPLRHAEEGKVNTCAGFSWSGDSLIHPVFTGWAADKGHVASIALCLEVASADLTKTALDGTPGRSPADARADAALAESILSDAKAANPARFAAVLAQIEASQPALLQQYIAKKGS